MKLSYGLILLGILIMLIGSGVAAAPLSSVSFGDIEIGGINPVWASLIGVGAIILVVGVGLYLKKK
jgi:hypothetical protein